jgi:hypothetical protein
MKRLLWAVVFASLLIPGEGAAQDPASLARMELLSGRLYLNYRNLETIYKEMHDHALAGLNESDEQLNYIQKTYFLINGAKAILFYQWELLSIQEYLREDAKGDYYTLRFRDLKRAIDDSKFSATLIALYAAYITDKEATKSIEEALSIIRGSVYMFEEFRRILAPLSNRPRIPYTIE